MDKITKFWANKPDDATMRMLDAAGRKALGQAPTDEEAKALQKDKEQRHEANTKLLGDISNILKMPLLGGGADDWGPGGGGGPTFRPGIGPGRGGGGYPGESPGPPQISGEKGAMGGYVHGHPVDPYGGLPPGTKLFEPVTGWTGGGVGGASAKFGPGMHEGVDLMAKVGSPVYASRDGTIVHAAGSTGLDQVITIDHGDGTYSRYLHQGPGLVKVGDKVKGGQQIGTSGYRNAPHTHFEMWRGVPSGRGSYLMNPKALYGWDKQHQPVGGREVRSQSKDFDEQKLQQLKQHDEDEHKQHVEDEHKEFPPNSEDQAKEDLMRKLNMAGAPVGDIEALKKWAGENKEVYRTIMKKYHDQEDSRRRIDGASTKKEGASIHFQFNNVPPGTKTKADADGFDKVKVDRSKVMVHDKPEMPEALR